MTLPLEGVRVIEVATWAFVPSSAGILADHGADVIKIEAPGGDPVRGLRTMLNRSLNGPHALLEMANRGKRSLTLDLRKPEANEFLMKLCEGADVFVTSYLPHLRRKLSIDIEDVRRANPDIIYARGSGWGTSGPMAETSGYDSAAAYASTGLAHRMTPPGGEPPVQTTAFFDLLSGATLAGAIGMALFQRLRTGHASVVDVSLMGVGLWAMAPDIVSAPYVDYKPASRQEPGNPLVNHYATSDGRWITFVLLQSERFWEEFCAVVDREDLLADERFTTMADRFEHRRTLVQELDKTFGERSLAEWSERLQGFSGVWAPIATFPEVHENAQILANGMLPVVHPQSGEDFRLVAAPMQFDEQTVGPATGAPEPGQHSEEIVLELGMTWDDVTNYLASGVLG